jgi:pimeloyl-ACP methyl ester carboxylesterase
MSSPQEHTIKVGSLKARYLVEGEGFPLILLHGAGGSGSGWLTNIGELSTRFRVYAPDLPGHGRTDKAPSGKYIFPDFQKFVSDIMSELNIDRAHLVGHSLGGAVALRMAIDLPTRVGKLVLISSAGLGRQINPVVCLASIPYLGEFLASLQVPPDVKEYARKVRSASWNTTHITGELLENLYEVEQTPGQYKTTLKILRTFVNWRGQKPEVHAPILQALPSITAPTLVIWGRQDNFLPLKHGELAASRLPNVRLEVFDKCGHLPMFDYATLLNRLILDFIGE